MSEYGILVDTTQCVGCYACEEACADRWGNPKTEAHSLSCVQNTAVQQKDDVFVPMLCMHCTDPTCASVCPVSALYKTPEGAVVYDADKCMGCRYCMQACPFNIPKYEWGSVNPRVTKCDQCHPRTSEGKLPACVESCPAQARIFGKREDLLAEAHKRLQEKPTEYHNAVYGEKEVGGTNTLYLAKMPFGDLGFKTNLPNTPMPQLTWQIMSKIPNYVFWGGTLLAGIWWITNRRNEVQMVEKKLGEMERNEPSRRTTEPHDSRRTR